MSAISNERVRSQSPPLSTPQAPWRLRTSFSRAKASTASASSTPSETTRSSSARGTSMAPPQPCAPRRPSVTQAHDMRNPRRPRGSARRRSMPPSIPMAMSALRPWAWSASRARCARERAPSRISSSESGMGGAPVVTSTGTTSAREISPARSPSWESTRRTASTFGPRVLPMARITLVPSLLHALDVGAGRGVDADAVPLGDERRHPDHQPRLHLGRLADVGDRGALDGGLRLHDRHLHRERQLDADRPALVHLDLELDVGDEVRHGIAQDVVAEPDLLEGLVVHEVEHVAVLVEELHLRLVQDGTLDHVHGPEPVLDDGARLQAADLGLDEPAEVAGRLVLAFDHAVEVVVVLDAHTALELGGLDHCALLPRRTETLIIKDFQPISRPRRSRRKGTGLKPSLRSASSTRGRRSGVAHTETIPP